MPDDSTAPTLTPVTTQEEPVQPVPTVLDTPLSVPDASGPSRIAATQGEPVSPLTQGEQPQGSTATPTSVEGTKTASIATSESDASGPASDASLNALLANLPPLQTTTGSQPGSTKLTKKKTKSNAIKPPLPTRKSSRLASS